jgi:HSP20 family protein
VSMRRWDPLRDILHLQERMNRLFEESVSRGLLEGLAVGSADWTPLCDVLETPEAFVVVMELPGVEQDDVEVQVDGSELVIRGERRLPGPARPESYQRMERSYGAFSRRVQLTDEVDPARVTAQFRDGLLRLELRKARPTAARRVRVERPE